MSLQTANAGQVRVLASIKPIQLIAQDMLGDLAQIGVLLPPGSSPHHYSLKPSSIAQMHDADLFIWGGPGLELFLTKTVSQLEHPALALLEGGEAHHHAEAQTADTEADTHHDHDHGGSDPHFWMAPERALAAADLIKDRLVDRYPENAALYEQAYNDFAARLAVTDQQLQQQLKAVGDTGFYVFHDAFGSFVTHYQLNQLGYFTVDPGRKPGARRLSEIRTALETNRARCVFVEPQFKAPVVDSLIRGLDIRVGRLDPLAVAIDVGPDGYSNYLQSLAESFTNCLSGE
ncbi:zinc ABC transporter substrate-binding protein ZnuA [Amphritea pacifica]|uniref:High-affinity zinc uptake system protein ZnuA n=1 Tax=Amphritea pacifica TaxID=2811233 RepID=A0ABS2W2R8_9GAMM|nr:zinc ABC transporter substrate-binding protein ZnuA [Amphritea pacifica]MBN0985896.1 zinc ABC transporter substrate-binding protein ZnuA [Amphritea pacifica]